MARSTYSTTIKLYLYCNIENYQEIAATFLFIDPQNSRMKTKLILGALLVIIIFHHFFETVLTTILVNPILSTAESSIVNDVTIILLLIVFVFLLFFSGSHSNRFSHGHVLLGFTVLAYLWYRINDGEVWHLTPFSVFRSIKYLDVLYACALIILVRAILPGKKKTENVTAENGFLEDISLGEDKEDLLGYDPYAETLAIKIKTSNVQQAFGIAVNGKWGAGKTSFIDLMKRKLSNEDIIIIDFNPWSSTTPAGMIKDFFDTLQDTLQPYNPRITHLLKKYVDKLADIDDSKLSGSLRAIIDSEEGDDSLDALFNRINDRIKSINKKLVIFIDDLDRLDQAELLEVIRLIRNTAKFHNTFFVVAVDRNYLLKAIEKYNPHNFHQFLEKIFQAEVILPHFRRDVLTKNLFENLKARFPESTHTQLAEVIFGNSMSIPVDTGEWLETMRDVTRYVNAVSLNIERLRGEVDLRDFLRVEMLRLKLPAIYELLYKKVDLFLTANQLYYQLSNVKDSGKLYLETYLSENAKQYGLTETDIGKIIRLVKGLFSDPLQYGFYKKSLLSIAYLNKFDRYFAYFVFDSQLSEQEFEIARNADIRFFEEKINEWVDRGLEREVAKKFEDVASFSGILDFEKIITAIFFFANHEKDDAPYFPVLGFDVDNLIKKIGYYGVNVYRNENSGEEPDSRLKTFLRDLLTTQSYPFHYGSEFVKHAMDKLNESPNFIMTFDELLTVNIEYLRKYTATSKELVWQTFRLFYNTMKKEWDPVGNGSYRERNTISDEAKEILLDFINKHFDEYLFMLIEHEGFNPTYTVSKTPLTLFGSWDEFEKFLGANRVNSTYLSEFMRFYDIVKKDNFSHYLPFKFETIPIKANP